MFTEIPVAKNVGHTQIKEVPYVIDLDSHIRELSVSPIPHEGCCLRADESSICMVTSDVSDADLLSAFESISFDMHPEHRNAITKDHVQDDAFEPVWEVDPFGRGSDGGKETSKVDLADSDSILDPSNQRNDGAEILGEIDKNNELNNPLIVYTSSRRSANNNKSNQSNEFHKTPRSDKRITNKSSAVDLSFSQILRRRRSLSSKRARSSAWGSLCNILPDFEESSGLNSNLYTERKPRGVTCVQRNRNCIRDKNSLKSITSSGRITLKIRIGTQSCVLGSVTDSVNESGKRIPELLVSTDKIEEQGPVSLVSQCKRNLVKVTPADSSILRTYPDVRGTLENPSCNTSSYHHQIISQAAGDNSGATTENKSSDPETSPDSEIINSIPDALLSEEALHMQGSPITAKVCVSSGDISNFSSPHTKSKNGKKKNNCSSVLVDAETDSLKSQVCEILVPCSHGKKIPKCPGTKGGSKSISTALDLPRKKDKASKKKGNKNNLGGKHLVKEATNANGVFGGVECPLISGHQTSPHLGDIGVPNKYLNEAVNSMQFSSCGERDQIAPLRNAWVLCDVCQKWRRIPSTLADKIEETNRGWTCKDNMDKDFGDCTIPQEKSNSEINKELEISDAEEACDTLLTSNQNRPKAHQESPWSLIRSNLFLQRSRKKQTIDEVMVCHCKPPLDGRMGCGDKCLNRILNIECVKGTCPCGELCSNQQFQKRKYARLERFKCGKKGYGLQAVENISEGQFLIEYVGEVLDMHAYEARQKEYALNGHKHFYFMTLNGSEVIDACAKGNLGRFINHSCDPNCRTEKWMVNGEVCVGLFAVKDIKKGEEVTFDYNYVRVFGAAAKRCVCGSLSCRGYIGGDPKNSEIIVQEDSDDEYPEPVMICEDSELKQVNAVGRLESITEAHTSEILDQAFADGCLKTSIAAIVVGDKSEINCAANAVTQSDMKQVIRESLNGFESATCMVQSEDLQSQMQSSSHFMDTPLQSVDIMKKLTKSSSLAHGSESPSTVSPSKSLTDAVEHKTKMKYAAVEGKHELVKSNSLAKTRRPSSSIKKGKIKSNVVNEKRTPVEEKLNEAADKSKKQPELSMNSQFEAVEGKLNDLLEPGGGISKRKDASKGYLKLLFLTAASGNNGHGGAIQSNRDLSMILDALLKTKSRTVLVDIIDKNGLQMLHNILKRYRKEFIKTPILRKLLKVLEYLAMREILTLEHITGGPPRPGAESFKDSILTLTEHADRQVHQIARNFRDRWIPRSHRRIEFHERSGYDGSSDSRDKWNDRSGKPSEAANPYESQTRTSETSSIEHSASANETKPRKRKSRWDNPDEHQHSRLKTDIGSDVMPEIDDDIPPGFSIPCNGSIAPSNNSSTPITHQERNTCLIDPRDIALGYSQQKFVSRTPISYGVPSSVMQQFGVFKAETSTGFTVAPGVPFYPFPPLPTYACDKIEQGSDNCTSRHAGKKYTRTWPTWDMYPPEENVPFANDWTDFQREDSFDFGRKFRQQKFNHSKLAPPWVRMRNGWGY